MNYHRDGTLPTDRSIFVFGSNLAGRHGLGAANVALNGYGAVYGVGVGPQNQSYAIPTKDETLQPLDIGIIRKYVQQFLRYAEHYQSLNEFFSGYGPQTTFFVTGIGCGAAGYKPEDIAPMFKGAPLNCSFPDVWKPYLE
jgi:hypothetical protein